MATAEKSKTAPIPTRHDEDDVEYLKIMAAESGRTLSQEVRRAVKSHIQKHKQMRSLGKRQDKS